MMVSFETDPGPPGPRSRRGRGSCTSAESRVGSDSPGTPGRSRRSRPGFAARVGVKDVAPAESDTGCGSLLGRLGAGPSRADLSDGEVPAESDHGPESSIGGHPTPAAPP
eukprot:763056-Hanusia_phi.AAC.2